MSRMIPSFFIIGERKCGTSSLFRYLTDHPQILPGKRKEPNFFIHDTGYLEAHWPEYQANFPIAQGTEPWELIWPELDEQGILYEEPVVYDRTTQARMITGEASANTFFDVNPDIVHRFLPDIKLIVLMREPVERAYSHYRMLQRFVAEGRQIGWELGTFVEEMEREMVNLQNANYGQLVAPSCYILKLPGWVEVFGWDRIKVIGSHDLAQTDALPGLMHQLYGWLGVDTLSTLRAIRYNEAPPSSLDKTLKMKLQEFFRPYNEALFDYLGYRMPWDLN